MPEVRLLPPELDDETEAQSNRRRQPPRGHRREALAVALLRESGIGYPPLEEELEKLGYEPL